MGDVWATVAEASKETQGMLADAMERRTEDPVFVDLRDQYFAALEPSGGTVIEMGCGPGDVTRALADRMGAETAIGIDPSPVMIDRALARHGDAQVRFEVGDARATNLEDGCADLILFHTTLCHIPAPERALAEARRLLKPGGRLVVFDGDYITTTAALRSDDPVDNVIQVAMTELVHDLYFCRTLPSVITAAGLAVEKTAVQPYLAKGNAAFFHSLFTRGLIFLKQDGVVGEAAADALLDEFDRRVKGGRFFGFCAFHLVVAKKEPT